MQNQLDGFSLYYEIYGEGTPLLLISGLGSDSSSWLGVAKGLSEYFQTIIFDNRGSGRSDKAPKGCSIGQMADDVVKLLDSLGIERAHIIGHSMGGYIAQELAIRHPERVNKLILEATALFSTKRNNFLLEDFFRQLQEGANFEAWIRRWAFWLFSRKCFNDAAFIETFVKNGRDYPYRQQADDFKAQIDAIASFDSRKKIAAIKAKALVLAGEEDIMKFPDESKELAENISGCVFRLLKDTGHSIHIENPGEFIKEILDFLR